MAVVSAAITGAILSAGQGNFPGSQNLARVASAVGRTLPLWLPLLTNVNVVGVTSGVAGVGTVNGKLFVSGGAALVVASLRQAGLGGPTATGLGLAVGTGVSAVLNSSAQYLGVSFGVGVGADASKVSFTNSATLIPLLLSNLRAAGVQGPQGPQLATGLGRGIAQLVQTGFGFGAVVGVPSPVGAVSTSLSTVL
jgi:hypothetical protein